MTTSDNDSVKSFDSFGDFADFLDESINDDEINLENGTHSIDNSRKFDRIKIYFMTVRRIIQLWIAENTDGSSKISVQSETNSNNHDDNGMDHDNENSLTVDEQFKNYVIRYVDINVKQQKKLVQKFEKIQRKFKSEQEKSRSTEAKLKIKSDRVNELTTENDRLNKELAEALRREKEAAKRLDGNSKPKCVHCQSDAKYRVKSIWYCSYGCAKAKSSPK